MNESMKILALIFLLIVSFCSVQAKPPEPPYEDSTYWNSEIITPDDPTTFQRIKYIGKEKRKMYHRGTDRDRPSRFDFKARPYVYHAFYENGLAIEFLVYYELEKNKNIINADILALEYAKALGRMPRILLQRLDALHAFADIPGISNANSNDRVINIYSSTVVLGGKLYVLDPTLEELLVHELVHASLDKPTRAYRPLNPKISKDNNETKKTIKLNWGDWRKAAKKDKGFVTKYAKTTPYEDLAESFLMWFALRYDRVEDSDKETILKLIPNRIQYFDEQQFDMYPFYNKLKMEEERTAKLILNPDTLTIFCKTQGDCWDAMLEDYQQYLKEPSYKVWVTTRNIISKEFNGNVWGWRTGGDSVMEVKVGANETCEKFKVSDDECVVVFLGNEFVDERIKKMFIDVDNGN